MTTFPNESDKCDRFENPSGLFNDLLMAFGEFASRQVIQKRWSDFSGFKFCVLAYEKSFETKFNRNYKSKLKIVKNLQETVWKIN